MKPEIEKTLEIIETLPKASGLLLSDWQRAFDKEGWCVTPGNQVMLVKSLKALASRTRDMESENNRLREALNNVRVKTDAQKYADCEWCYLVNYIACQALDADNQ